MKIQNIRIDMGDYERAFALRVDGKDEITMRDLAGDCPEDATLARDLGVVYRISDLMVRAANAAKAGEEVEVETLDLTREKAEELGYW